MYRSLMGALLLLGLCAFTALAKEHKGNVTKVDPDKNLITVKVGDEEKTFTFTDKTMFIGPKGKEISREGLSKLAEKLAEKARPATIETEEKDGTEVVKDGKPVATKVTFRRGKKSG
jgi:hypothetical protein